jgi:uncharacterized membrane protein
MEGISGPTREECAEFQGVIGGPGGVTSRFKIGGDLRTVGVPQDFIRENQALGPGDSAKFVNFSERQADKGLAVVEAQRCPMTSRSVLASLSAAMSVMRLPGVFTIS